MEKHIRLLVADPLVECSRSPSEGIPGSTVNQAYKPLDKSEVPCWSCRRRRVLCDRTRPTCTKCHQSGRECLGYKKPLVWNKGVASRGKMMGKDFEAANVTQIQEVRDAKNLRESPPSALQKPNGNSGHFDAAMPIEIAYQDNRFYRVLVDPIFQGLGPVPRYYLDYCM